MVSRALRETLYWLQLIKVKSLTTVDLDQPVDEADPRFAILRFPFLSSVLL